MTIDEGYIKYKALWTLAPAPDVAAAAKLETWRQPLIASGLIGHYDKLGIGYGNISLRSGTAGRFLISGTQTGNITKTDESHYSLVTDYDIQANTVSCVGPVQASSEAMTHATIYELDANINAIVHVHSHELWQQYRNVLPTTREEVAYGTPQMAMEFRRLFEETTFDSGGLAVMGGHEDGLISIGSTLEQAANRMLHLLDSAADT